MFQVSSTSGAEMLQQICVYQEADNQGFHLV